MRYKGKVTTGGEVIAELYEVSARYQTAGRPDYSKHDASRVFNSGALWLWLETAYGRLQTIGGSDDLTAAEMRRELLNLATGAVAWAREIREQCQ